MGGRQDHVRGRPGARLGAREGHWVARGLQRAGEARGQGGGRGRGRPSLERGARSRRHQALQGVSRSRQLPLAGQGRRPIRREGGLSTHGGSCTGHLGKIEAVDPLLAPVSPALVDVQEERVRDGHHRRVLRLRLGGICPYSAIRVGRRHRRRISDKAFELDAGDGGPLEWRGGVSGLGKGSLRGNRHPGVGP